jgi:hypothetical protein
MSDFPANLHEMKRMGYTKTGYAKCKGCGAAIEWWQTPRAGKIPMNPMPMHGADDHAPAVAHFATCPKAKDFRASSAQRKGSQLEPFSDIAARTPMGTAEALPSPPAAGDRRETSGLERDVDALRRKHNARVVALVADDGKCAFWRGGIPAENLRADLISAANFVRDSIAQKEAQR